MNKMNEPRFFGHYLVSKEIITPAKLAAATEYQTQVNVRLGEYAVARGLLNQSEVDKITAQQLSEDLLFGEVAVKMGLLENTSLNELLAAQRLDHMLLGEALVALGYVTKEEIDEALAVFLREEEQHAKSMFAIPAEIPLQQCAHNLFRLTHLLLHRAWGVRNKPGEIQITSDALRLSDWNAGADFTGDLAIRVAIALPHAIAISWAQQVAGDKPIQEESLDEIVRKFVSIVGANLTTTLKSEQVKVEMSAPVNVDFRVPLTDNKRAAIMPFITSEGRIFAAMVYEAKP
jgi:CheY-specific phosphatase CheX